jgi:hypothetical protein
VVVEDACLLIEAQQPVIERDPQIPVLILTH